MHDEVVLLPSTALAGLPPPQLEVRQRRLASTIVGSVAALVALAAAAAPFILEGSVPSWLAIGGALWFGGFAALFAWFSLRHALNAGRAGAWVLREDGQHLLVNLRSHLNVHFDPATPSILVLPHRRVRSLSVLHERGLRTHVGDRGTVFENPIRREFLDISFDGEAQPVADALAAERARWGKAALGRSRNNHSAVRLLPNGVLRVAWRDETNRLRPPLAALQQKLGHRYAFTQPSAREQAPLRDLDKSAQESRLLEMVARGERVQAVALAKVLYGMDTTEAVRFVDSLQG